MKKTDANFLLFKKKQSCQFFLGIDPGVITGYSLWDKTAKSFRFVSSAGICVVMQWLLKPENYLNKDRLLVRLEDARKRVWFGESGKEKWQGAGSIKRDCQVWEEFFLLHDISFELVPPKKNKTKLDADLFAKYTGWKERTNEHSRDSGMLVYGN